MENEKREEIITSLISEGWGPNLDYLNTEYVDLYWIVKKYSDEKGKFHTEYNDGRKLCSDCNYLISPSKRYALSVKTETITLHDAMKNYDKILTMQIEDIELIASGLKNGKLILLYKD